MDLQTLIQELTIIYQNYGNLKTEVMRNGDHYPEIELYNDGETVYIEAYQEGE